MNYKYMNEKQLDELNDEWNTLNTEISQRARMIVQMNLVIKEYSDRMEEIEDILELNANKESLN